MGKWFWQFWSAGNFVDGPFGYLGDCKVFYKNFDTAVGLVFDGFDNLAD